MNAVVSLGVSSTLCLNSLSICTYCFIFFLEYIVFLVAFLDHNLVELQNLECVHCICINREPLRFVRAIHCLKTNL